MMQSGNRQKASRPSRIPLTLQAVFMASNRGKDIHKPPPLQVAYRTFVGAFSFQRKNNARGASKKSPRGSKDVPTESTQTGKVDQKKETQTQDVQKQQIKSTTPQEFLDSILSSRGYSTEAFNAMSTAYYNKPTELQRASYGTYLVGLIRNGEKDKFRSIMSSGISPNPCNNFGESVLHLVCRRADVETLNILVESGCTMQITDDYGRTPLHDACWAPAETACFKKVDMILKHDIRMFYLRDRRGSLPLSYVEKDQWGAWIDFLDAKKDEYWPPRNVAVDGTEPVPPLVLQGPNTRPVPDPENRLSIELARMVVEGRLEPNEAQMLKVTEQDETCEESDDESGFDSDDDDDSYSDDDYSESLNDEDMEALVSQMSIK